MGQNEKGFIKKISIGFDRTSSRFLKAHIFQETHRFRKKFGIVTICIHAVTGITAYGMQGIDGF
jgi:hypothetical protein